MATVTAHVITAATWEYVTVEGKRRRAFFGDTVDLTEDEVERGLNVGAIGVELPAEEPAAEEGESEAAESESDEDQLDSADPDADVGADDSDPAEPQGDDGDEAQLRADGRPLKIAKKDVLVDWLMAHGTYDRDELESQDKDDLWALIEATD
ncbi:hypothetical protein [Mycobacteroides abscessus]|uniref:hypothetical protein n=1 Tax=Mycobacteroides abscessus TaxID=36809 RepID=UPI0007F9746D|nr:hypothetical protein [Mycobacteroides abscessus]ANN98198.1 hypothetical protein BAB74_05165 [Mycobacteroides abscessus]